MNTVQVQGKVNSFEKLIVALVVLSYSLCIFFWALSRGVIGVARNDDWVYLHMAKWLAESGIVQVESGSMTNAFGLIFLSEPVIRVFGYSIGTLQIFVAVLGTFGVFFCWLLLRSFLSISFSIIAILTLLVSPFWASMSFSYMTDVPAFTFQIIALWLAVKAFQGESLNIFSLASAYLVSIFAFSIREYAIAAGIAISGYIFTNKIKSSKRHFSFAIFFIAGWLLACIAIFSWRSNLPNVTHFETQFEISILKDSLIQAIRAMAMLGLFIIPALMVSSPFVFWKKITSRRNKYFGFVLPSVFLAIMVMLFKQRGLLFGNYITPRGSYIETFALGEPTNVVWPVVFEAISWFGVVAIAYFLWLVSVDFLESNRGIWSSILNFVREGSPTFLVSLFSFVYFVLLTFIPLVTNAPLFDRYYIILLPLIPALILNFLNNRSVSSKARYYAAIASLGLLAFFSAILIDSSFILDGLKWRAGNELVAKGYDAQTVDAGYEWFGYHQNQIADGSHIVPIRNWWTTLYTNPVVCASVGSGQYDSGVTEGRIVQQYVVENFIGTNLTVWSTNAQPSCNK